MGDAKAERHAATARANLAKGRERARVFYVARVRARIGGDAVALLAVIGGAASACDAPLRARVERHLARIEARGYRRGWLAHAARVRRGGQR